MFIIYCYEFAPISNSVYPRPHELCINTSTCMVQDRLLLTSHCVQCTLQYASQSFFSHPQQCTHLRYRNHLCWARVKFASTFILFCSNIRTNGSWLRNFVFFGFYSIWFVCARGEKKVMCTERYIFLLQTSKNESLPSLKKTPRSAVLQGSLIHFSILYFFHFSVI